MYKGGSAMQKYRGIEASPVLSVIAAQGGRVTGKAAKERPRKDGERRSFDDYLRKAGYASDDAGEQGHVHAEGVDTLA